MRLHTIYIRFKKTAAASSDRNAFTIEFNQCSRRMKILINSAKTLPKSIYIKPQDTRVGVSSLVNPKASTEQPPTKSRTKPHVPCWVQELFHASSRWAMSVTTGMYHPESNPGVLSRLYFGFTGTALRVRGCDVTK